MLILALFNSPAAAGFAGALQWLPYVLFSLPAGALVDRWNRKQVMIVCTLGLTLCIASIPIALLTSHLTILQVYLVSFLIGTLSLFYGLAELAALTRVVPKAQLPAAVAQNEIVYSINSLLAPPSSILLFSVSRLFPFIADTASYLILLGSLLRIRTSFQGERGEASQHLLKDMREGIRWLWTHSIIRSLAFLSGYLYTIMAGSVLIILVIARQHSIPSTTTAIIFAIGGVGNIVGTALCTPFQRRIRFGWALGSMLILFVFLWPLYGLTSSPIILAAIVAALAIIDSISSILIASYRLGAVPDELQGRVGSIYRLILYSTLALGQALIGPCLEHFGVFATVAILWGGLLVFTTIMVINPRVRMALHPLG